MIKVLNDLTGKKFGKLTVIAQVEDYISPNEKHMAQWLCQCSCGSQCVVLGVNLTRKNQSTKSCGCLRNGNGIKNHKTNNYDLSGEYGVGWTFNTNKEFYFDLEDYDLIKDYCWYEYTNSKTGYKSLRTRERGSRKSILMTTLLGCRFFDHIDRNPLNCRKINLRRATVAENAKNKSKNKRNTSGVTGVYWHKIQQSWFANISVDYQRIHLGYFKNKNDAIKARLQAEAQYFKSFAPQKHLFEQYEIITNQND